jgi:hypothetical protein
LEGLTPEQLLSRIRGKRRQDIARELYKEFGFASLNEFLVRDGLSEEDRTAWGAAGPWFLALIFVAKFAFMQAPT